MCNYVTVMNYVTVHYDVKLFHILYFIYSYLNTHMAALMGIGQMLRICTGGRTLPPPTSLLLPCRLA